MPNWFSLALPLLQFRVSFHSSSVSLIVDVPDKRIAIVGAGLKTLVDDLPKDLTRTWEIVLFEQRDDVGGICDHSSLPIPPRNSAHTFVLQYQKSMISRWNLSSYIHPRHEVLAADWHGDNVSGHWQLTALDHTHNRTVHARFDHLIFQGRHAWETSAPGRKILHSIFYREPEVYRGRNILVVGGGSGQDMAQQVVGVANSSLPLFPFPFPHIPEVERAGAVSHFTPRAPVFEHGTSLPQIDTVLLATGYELRIPFLPFIRNTTLSTPLPDPDDCDALTNNGRYLRPLFWHVLSLAPTHAPRALAFIGLPTFVEYGISDYAQALLVAHALADPALLADLRAQEAAHDDPARIGHRILPPGGGAAYQDGLVAILQDRGREGGGVPPRGTRFTEPWREFATRETMRLHRAWFEVEARGEDQVRKCLGTVKRGDEAEWAELTVRLVEWYEDQVSQGGTCSGERDG
ncbi:FAD/NAD-P-binding domain-containing protein [Lactarius deliciosus]|nr:FAD/NAD-P-binding domain-containing protein [Lactarius deliciosus]